MLVKAPLNGMGRYYSNRDDDRSIRFYNHYKKGNFILSSVFFYIYKTRKHSSSVITDANRV